jgi:hypothetical protein
LNDLSSFTLRHSMFINHYSIFDESGPSLANPAAAGEEPFNLPAPLTSLRSFELRPGWQAQGPAWQAERSSGVAAT